MLALPWKCSNPLNCIYPGWKCVLNKLKKSVRKNLAVLQGKGAEGPRAPHLKN